MKKVLNEVLRFLIGFGLKSYYKEIKITGLENIPKNKPILILPNHQNGLIDPVLIGTLCKLNPYYLARSDVFKNPIANWFLRTIQMLPIYRIRDGRNSLQKNEEIFDQCSELLLKGNHLMMFPEGSHGLDRRVRILKNGFYHIIDRALKNNPNIDLQLLPIGFNYDRLENFPDRVAIKIGAPLSVQKLIAKVEQEERLKLLKKTLRDSLIKLTTHIEDQKIYTEVFEYLHYKNVDFLEPEKNNELIATYQSSSIETVRKTTGKTSKRRLPKAILYILNFPIILIWKHILKPERLDLEFISTFRYAFAAIGYVLFMASLYIICSLYLPSYIVLIGILIHYLISRLVVKSI